MFSDVQGLGESLKVQQSSSKLQIRVGDSAIGFVFRDQSVLDVVATGDAKEEA